MYKVLEVSPTGKCLPGISTEPGINSRGKVHYWPQVGYHNTYGSQVLQYFGNALVCSVYITWSKQFKLWKLPFVVGSIVVVGGLTRYALFHFFCNLKALQMNMQFSLIWEFKLYKFELGSNTIEVTKNICCTKGEQTNDYNTVSRWLKRFCLGYKDFDDQTRSGRFCGCAPNQRDKSGK